MPKKILAGTRRAATLALGLSLSAMPAYAGFEWVAPSNDPGSSASNSVYVAPQPSSSANAAPEIISPVIISGTPGASYGTPTQVISSASSAPVPITPPPAAPEPVLSPPPAAPMSMPRDGKPSLANETISMSPSSTSAASPGPMHGGEIVQGFATQIPLTLALRQLLPAGDTFALDQDVDSNTLVSFKGGKSWHETLSDMLAPVSLVYHEADHAVVISRAAAATAPPATAAVPPLPEPVNVKSAYLNAPGSSRGGAGASMAVSGDWSADRGQTLHQVLTEWCRLSNTELQWLAEYDYPIEGSAHFTGSFEDAVRNILAGFDGARPQPIGELHNNTSAGQTILVIQTRGNSYSN